MPPNNLETPTLSLVIATFYAPEFWFAPIFLTCINQCMGGALWMYLVHRSALKEDVLEIGVLFKEVRFSELDFAEEVEFRN